MRPAADIGEVAVGMFHRHGRAVRRFLYRLTRNPAAADDLAGEVFLRVVQAAPAYEPREREAAWVFRIAQNVWRDANRRRIRSVEDARAADVASPANQVEGLDLQRGLEALPEDERVALLLGEMGGLSYAEIAERDRLDGAGGPVAHLPGAPDPARPPPAAAARGGRTLARFP